MALKCYLQRCVKQLLASVHWGKSEKVHHERCARLGDIDWSRHLTHQGSELA